jgi:hypothetical protein
MRQEDEHYVIARGAAWTILVASEKGPREVQQRLLGHGKVEAAEVGNRSADL